MNKDRNFKLTEITKIFNVKEHFIIHLVEVGIIKPLKDVRGRGKSRLYSYKNLIQIGIFVYLNKWNLSYEMIKIILNEVDRLMEYDEEAIETLVYVCAIGSLNGSIEFSAHYHFFPDKTSPEGFLTICKEDKIKKEKDLGKNGLAYYFILDVNNIRKFINLKIEQL